MLKSYQPIKIVILFALLFSFTNCCTTKNELKEEKKVEATDLKKEYAPIPLAPGTAEVCGLITSIVDKDGLSLCKLNVNEVKRYGPSTKPIGVGSEIEFQIKENHLEKLNEFLSNKNEVTVTIAILRGGIGQEPFSGWKLIKINY